MRRLGLNDEVSENKMMQIGSLSLPVIAIVALATAFGQQYPPPYPRPNTTKRLENERVIVWEVTWPKNQPTPLHEHPYDQFSVTLVGGTVKVTRLGADPTVNHSTLGSVAFTPKGTIHVEEGMSDVPQQKIMLEIKPSAPAAGEATADFKIPPREGAMKVLENERLIAWDIRWDSGFRVAPYFYRFDTVTVFIEPGLLHTVDEQGDIKEIGVKAGDVMYAARSPEAHSEQAVRGSPRAIVIELK